MLPIRPVALPSRAYSLNQAVALSIYHSSVCLSVCLQPLLCYRSNHYQVSAAVALLHLLLHMCLFVSACSCPCARVLYLSRYWRVRWTSIGSLVLQHKTIYVIASSVIKVPSFAVCVCVSVWCWVGAASATVPGTAAAAFACASTARRAAAPRTSSRQSQWHTRTHLHSEAATQATQAASERDIGGLAVVVAVLDGWLVVASRRFVVVVVVCRRRAVATTSTPHRATIVSFLSLTQR